MSQQPDEQSKSPAARNAPFAQKDSVTGNAMPKKTSGSLGVSLVERMDRRAYAKAKEGLPKIEKTSPKPAA